MVVEMVVGWLVAETAVEEGDLVGWWHRRVKLAVVVVVVVVVEEEEDACSCWRALGLKDKRARRDGMVSRSALSGLL